MATMAAQVKHAKAIAVPTNAVTRMLSNTTEANVSKQIFKIYFVYDGHQE